MAQRIRQDKIKGSSGQPLLVSTVQLPSGEYETGVFTSDWDELELSQCQDVTSALKIHREYIVRYAVAELSGRYKRLADDLKAAVKAAEFAAGGDDGGTCNFDSLMLYLPRWNGKMVKQAAEDAGISVFSSTYCGRKCWLFGVPAGGQAARRTRQAKSMAQTMKAAGYTAGVYYQMD